MHALTLIFCVVPPLFGYDSNLAIWGCLRIRSRTSQHGAKTSVCGAAPLPCDREGTYVHEHVSISKLKKRSQSCV